MKIISLQPSVSVILERLGRLECLAAYTKYCLDAVPALRERNLPVVHDSWSTKVEELLPVQADLVIASVPYRGESLAEILKASQPVLALAPHTLDDIYSDIRLVASIVDAVPQGEQVVAAMQTAIETIQAQTKNLPRILVHCEEWGKPIIHSQPWVAQLVKAAGGSFLGSPGANNTSEAVAEANPEIILAAWCGAGNRVPLEKIIAQRNWQTLSAIQSGHVYCIADELLNTPVPNLIDGLHAIASALHPEIFGMPTPPSIRRMDQITSVSV